MKALGVYLLQAMLATAARNRLGNSQAEATYDRALIFLLLRLRRRTRFFLHLALIVNEFEAAGRSA